MHARRRDILPDLLVCLCLAALTIGVFARVAHNDFVGYDDPDYVTSNHYVQQGLTRESVRWAFTTTHAANWHPLTWLSHMLDVQLFGMRPAAHHFTNVALHALSAVLLYVFLKTTTANRWAAALVACVFAIHPLRVESVAWASERKDVLAALFWMLTLLAYAYYARRPSFIRYVLVFTSLAMGLCAKPMLVSLPLVLLLLDYWPLQRSYVEPVERDPRLTRRRRVARWRKLIEEKFPLLLLSLASSVVTFWAQHSGGTVVSARNFPVTQRLANSSLGCVRYLGKLFWPTKLAVFYPRDPYIPLSHWLPALMLLSAITIVVLIFARRAPEWFVGWFWFLITLVPVIGIVQVGEQAIADRYTYLPLIGPVLAIAYGAARLARTSPIAHRALAAAGVACVIAMALLTWRQIGFWRDTYTLFAHALDVTDRNYRALSFVGTELGKRGQSDEAIAYFKAALEIDPAYAEAHFNLANHLARRGQTAEAIAHYQRAVELKPNLADAHAMLGLLWWRAGRLDLAAESYTTALDLDPDNAQTETALGSVLLESGRIGVAVQHFRRALQLHPDDPKAVRGLQNAAAMVAARQHMQSTQPATATSPAR